MTLNLSLALRLALQSLRYHRIVAAATILGVAIGMTVVGAILIVDNNTAQTPAQRQQLVRMGRTRHLSRAPVHPPTGSPTRRLEITNIAFIRQAELSRRRTSVFPTQKGQGRRPISDATPSARHGEEDYQTMRLAVRLASLLAFAIGTVIVFFTMRFSVASRSRACSLLLCLGEYRANVGLSLLLEALLLGTAGTLLGELLALPTAGVLLDLGISTTGQMPLPSFAVPWADLGVLGAISIVIAVLGVVGPLYSLYRMQIAAVLQPRFLTADIGAEHFTTRSVLWVIPPILAATYLVIRPFLLSWLSVVQFFLFEAVFVVGLAAMALWCIQPLLRLAIGAFERLLRPFLPLETLLTGQRMRLASQKIVFSIVGVTLVFSLLISLHDITRALKTEIYRWASEALVPYVYYTRGTLQEFDETAWQKRLHQEGLYFFRLSAKGPGAFPMRLMRAEDVNTYRQTQGRPLLRPGTVIVSKTLAARFGLNAGDVVEMRRGEDVHGFEVIDITDDIGFFAENAPYADLKSYALFSEGNPLFADNLETTLGLYGAARLRPSQHTSWWRVKPYTLLLPHYRFFKRGSSLGVGQQREIDRDFLIFDFIMLMTLGLAGIGVANTLLMQVQARHREFSVLRTVGLSRWQIAKLLVLEGSIIGLISAVLSLILGHALGAISVTFLDRFTLFDYEFVFALKGSVAIACLAVVACCCAALYPAVVAARTSSAESLHYE